MKGLKLTPEQEAAVLRNPKKKAAFRILMWFASVESKGATVDACEDALGLRHQSASPRVNELARVGCLILTGERRSTRSNRTAAVYKYQKGSSFIAYLGMPSKSKTLQRAGLTVQQQTILAAAQAYVKARPKAHSTEQVKKLVVDLLRALNNVAAEPSV
jgi:hypothetical protein